MQMLMAGGGFTPVIYVVTTNGSGSYTAPVGATKVTVEAIGGGGTGFGNTTTGNRAGGGGGTYATSVDLSVTGGSTVVYYQCGTNAQDSWVNVGTNAAPTANTTGCLAKAGTNASSGTAGTGLTTNCIGTTTRAGGTGTTGTNGAGGGGSGASTAGSGTTAGTDTTGLSPSNLMGGGTGGARGSVGTAPGGGGGSDTVTGTNRIGAIGRVRIRFT